MINLRTYITIKEEMDADNLSWKVNNWTNQLDDTQKNAFDILKSDTKSCKDMKSFKELVNKSGIDFKALVDAIADDAIGKENIDELYLMKKIIDSMNMKNKE